MPFIILDTFKGQNNGAILNLCKKHFCHSVIVRHNLTNKFKPLDIIANKPANSLISNKCNAQFSEQVSQQLEKGIQPAEASLALTELKAMNARWIVDLYQYLFRKQEVILNSFKAAGFTEAAESVNAVLHRIENPFIKKKMWTFVCNYAFRWLKRIFTESCYCQVKEHVCYLSKQVSTGFRC